jgi:hypothetical protein
MMSAIDDFDRYTSYEIPELPEDPDALKAEIVAWRESEGLPTEGATIEELARRSGIEHALTWRGYWVLTPVEAAHVCGRADRANEAFPPELRQWLESDQAEIWAGRDEESRPEARVVVLQFTEVNEALIADVRARSPRPELLEFRRAKHTETHLLGLLDRVSGDWDELEERGIFVTSTGLMPHGAELDMCAADEQAARRTLRERYGPELAVTWLGPTTTEVKAVPWATYQRVSEVELLLRYATNAAFVPRGIEVEESPSVIRLKVLEEMPVGAHTLVRDAREVTAHLVAPIAGRSVIDAAHDAVRCEWRSAGG